MGQVLLKLMLGAAAGFLGWLVIEPTAPAPLTDDWTQFERIMLFVHGLAVGTVIGGLNGWQQGSRVHLIRGLLLGAAFGAVGASIGYQLGGALGEAIFGDIGSQVGGVNPVTAILWRITSITPMGLFIGAAIGASTLNWRRIIQGAIGGTIGAGLGSSVFDIIASILSAPMAIAGSGGEGGQVSRAVLFTLMGGAIGMFIGIIEEVAKSAWVRLVLGRNEGKQWVVYSPQTFIGRSETAQIPLFGDPNVAPRHAVIVRQGPQYILMDGGAPAGTFLNGQRIQQAPLFPGAVINIGQFTLEFQMKAGGAPSMTPEMLRAQQAYSLHQPVPQHPGFGMQQQFPAAPAGHPADPYPTAQPGQVTHAPYQPSSQPTYPAPAQPQQASQPTQMAPQPLSLFAIAGPMSGQVISVSGPIEAGREAAGIMLAGDAQASRRHASFAPTADGIVVTDLGSTNGTFVNGQRIQSTTLRKGDTVRIGTTTFRVE